MPVGIVESTVESYRGVRSAVTDEQLDQMGETVSVTYFYVLRLDIVGIVVKRVRANGKMLQSKVHLSINSPGKLSADVSLSTLKSQDEQNNPSPNLF